MPHSVFRHDGFGMVLDAFEGKGLVADAHDFAVFGASRDFEAVGERLLFEGEGVVTHRLEILRNSTDGMEG